MKTRSIIISLIVTLCSSAIAIAAPSPLILVFDRAAQESPVAKKFRILPDLAASASGQFCADELVKILGTIPSPRQDIWIVDLRQESHGFIDGLPISWVSDRNAANVDKTADQIEKEEKNLISDLRLRKTITVYELKKLADGKVSAGSATIMLPETVETETQLVQSLGAKYARIFVLDHNKPDDRQVDNFVNFIKYKVKKEDWLHFHCRGGAGRSSTFIAMYDMIRNANDLTFIEIMHRQANTGSIKLFDMPTTPDKIWKSNGAQQRYVFLCKFYAYVIDPNGYNVRSFSDWQKLYATK